MLSSIEEGIFGEQDELTQVEQEQNESEEDEQELDDLPVILTYFVYK